MVTTTLEDLREKATGGVGADVCEKMYILHFGEIELGEIDAHFLTIFL